VKTLYFDCFSGISGDMTIGALIDLGLDFSYLEAEIGKLPVEGFTLSASRVTRAGISASKFDVLIGDATETTPHAHAADHHHNHHRHHHHEQHSHSVPGHAHPDDMATGHTGLGHRRASEIIGMIRTSRLEPRARDRAIGIFEKLAVSEGRVHRMPPGEVSFHEVGALDSIVDVVGAAVGFEALGIEQAVCSPVNVGGGFIQCQHGIYPVPAPATSNLLEGVPVYSKHVETELVTPTGAAILASTVDRYGPMDGFRIEKVGYGAGTKDLGSFPNCLRLFLGEQAGLGGGAGDSTGQVVLIEANIDDMRGEELAWASEKLMASGALDVLVLPAIMKKGRPGHVLQVMSRPGQEETLIQIIFEETTTIGLRAQIITRRVLERHTVDIRTPHGSIGVKVASHNGRVLNVSPEYEDCARVARETGIPFQTIREEAVRSYLAAIPAPAE